MQHKPDPLLSCRFLKYFSFCFFKVLLFSVFSCNQQVLGLININDQIGYCVLVNPHSQAVQENLLVCLQKMLCRWYTSSVWNITIHEPRGLSPFRKASLCGARTFTLLRMTVLRVCLFVCFWERSHFPWQKGQKQSKTFRTHLSLHLSSVCIIPRRPVSCFICFLSLSNSLLS